MTERQQLLAMLARLAPDDEVVLATVVKVEGSAYRRPGARMLIPRYGSAIGTLSGGCLESEISKKAWHLTEAGLSPVCRYSTATLAADTHGEAGNDSDEEAELTFGLGCNGTVHVLLQRLRVDTPLFALLARVEQGRHGAAQALVIGNSSDSGPKIGDCLAIGVDNEAIGLFADPLIHAAVLAELMAVRAAGQSRLLRFQRTDGELELLLEYLPPKPALVIIGAGHDAEPLARMAVLLGWRVTVIDGRRHFARPERFPGAEVHCRTPETIQPDELAPAAVVIMSHSFSQDRSWLRHFIDKLPPYLGQLGPRSRTDRLLGELANEPRLQQALARLRAPVGLDLGGSTPETVALAILAEAQAALNGRAGGELKAREAPIHSAEPVSIKAWPETGGGGGP